MDTKKIKYSFIIPVKGINNFIRESVSKILEIKRDDFEVIIYPDEINPEFWPKTRQIKTGNVGPAQKRSLAIKDALGEILVFIDDDAYPNPDFLAKLDFDFNDEKVAAVGGPALTPSNDNFWQKVSGSIFLSKMAGGFPERYSSVGVKRYIDDWPSVNLSVRKEVFIKVGGFDCAYWPGEDTKFCLDLVEKLKGKILYDPELIVWHHRRQGLFKHLNQIGNYGLHRGFFAKKFPQTSFRLKYFLPSFFLAYVALGIFASLLFSPFIKLYLLGWLIYLSALIFASWEIYKHEKNILIILNSLYYIFFTHLIYGLKFIQGFVFVKELKSKLR
jgi:cellulose synthase/poly-beta-1,6-N-acetylglucosamine synthase-like glycosyltransferase